MSPRHPLTPNDIILALDVGERRIGLAIASAAARLPRTLETLARDGETVHELQSIVAAEKATVIVVGLPRDLEGRATEQTVATEAFVAELRPALGLTTYWQDEALTSVKAEAELKARGLPFSKADVDALSAVYILEDFLQENHGGRL